MRLPFPRLIGRLMAVCYLCLACGFVASAQHDLSIFRVSSDTYLERGDIVSFTFVVTNDKGTDVSGVGVDVAIPTGLRYLQHSLSQTFDPSTGRWDIGDIPVLPAAAHHHHRLRGRRGGRADRRGRGRDHGRDGLRFHARQRGLGRGRHRLGVRDRPHPRRVRTIGARGCSRWLPPAYEWYRDGVLLAGETTNVINVGASGRYKFQIPGSTSTCVLGSCCPGGSDLR